MSPAPDKDIARLLGHEGLGLEGRAAADDHQSLKLWLRLLSCSTEIETEVRKRLRTRFGISLARFDYLAQLHRHPEGLTMGALSRYLMVTGGNVTGLTDELQAEGLVERASHPGDRRATHVKLTARGRAQFELMAGEHEAWIVELFAGLSAAERKTMGTLLAQLRVQLAQRLKPQPPANEEGRP